ncbi:MAG: efflux RND transporter periplasmic adaptor subunit [Chitinophagaceae bacterium]|nr:efflux RND transporter periplasmic adaptor subunit [Chitinophagaceae bacterium]
MRHFIYSVIAISFLISSCGDNKPPAPMAPPPVKVVLEPVITGSTVYYEEYPATLTPLNQVDLRPQVSGYVTGIHFKDGNRVKKGQLLYSIDAQLYNANYNQAVASLNAQEANLVKAQKDADRYHELAKNDAVAKQLVDNADAALEVAKRQVEAARANIAASQTSVRYTKIYAPFDGLIGISQVKVGAPVTAGSTILNTVSTDHNMAVDFNIDQKNIYYFTGLLNKKTGDSTFTLAFGSNIYPVPGKLILLDRSVDPQTGTIKARLEFPNEKDMLRAGMNGKIRVRTTAPANTMLIPYKAVVEQLGEYFVYVPGDSNKVSQKKVTLGVPIGKNIIVKEGLNPTDSVVAQGIQNLREGSVIQSVPASQPDGQVKK